MGMDYMLGRNAIDQSYRDGLGRRGRSRTRTTASGATRRTRSIRRRRPASCRAARTPASRIPYMASAGARRLRAAEVLHRQRRGVVGQRGDDQLERAAVLGRGVLDEKEAPNAAPGANGQEEVARALAIRWRRPSAGTSAKSSWARPRDERRMFFDPQRSAGASPTDRGHPGRRLDGGGGVTRLQGGALPPVEMRTRASRVDARGRAKVLSKVEQDVDHAPSHLPRRRERPDVVAIADNLSFAAERAVHGQRQANGEPVDPPAGAARLVPFDDEVAVVLLNRKVDHAESVERGPRDRRAERPEHARRAQDGSPGAARIVTCSG